MIKEQSALHRLGLRSARKNPAMVAIHEAGHLAACLVLGITLHETAATISLYGDRKGAVFSESLAELLTYRVSPTRTRIEEYAISYLAGMAAEEVARGRCLEDMSLEGWGSDHAAVAEALQYLTPTLAEWRGGERFRRHYKDLLLTRAEALMIEHWSAVEALALDLAKRGELRREEAMEIAARHGLEARAYALPAPSHV